MMTLLNNVIYAPHNLNGLRSLLLLQDDFLDQKSWLLEIEKYDGSAS